MDECIEGFLGLMLDEKIGMRHDKKHEVWALWKESWVYDHPDWDMSKTEQELKRMQRRDRRHEREG